MSGIPRKRKLAATKSRRVKRMRDARGRFLSTKRKTKPSRHSSTSERSTKSRRSRSSRSASSRRSRRRSRGRRARRAQSEASDLDSGSPIDTVSSGRSSRSKSRYTPILDANMGSPKTILRDGSSSSKRRSKVLLRSKSRGRSRTREESKYTPILEPNRSSPKTILRDRSGSTGRRLQRSKSRGRSKTRYDDPYLTPLNDDDDGESPRTLKLAPSSSIRREPLSLRSRSRSRSGSRMHSKLSTPASGARSPETMRLGSSSRPSSFVGSSQRSKEIELEEEPIEPVAEPEEESDEGTPRRPWSAKKRSRVFAPYEGIVARRAKMDDDEDEEEEEDDDAPSTEEGTSGRRKRRQKKSTTKCFG